MSNYEDKSVSKVPQQDNTTLAQSDVGLKARRTQMSAPMNEAVQYIPSLSPDKSQLNLPTGRLAESKYKIKRQPESYTSYVKFRELNIPTNLNSIREAVGFIRKNISLEDGLNSLRAEINSVNLLDPFKGRYMPKDIFLTYETLADELLHRIDSVNREIDDYVQSVVNFAYRKGIDISLPDSTSPLNYFHKMKINLKLLQAELLERLEELEKRDTTSMGETNLFSKQEANKVEQNSLKENIVKVEANEILKVSKYFMSLSEFLNVPESEMIHLSKEYLRVQLGNYVVGDRDYEGISLDIELTERALTTAQSTISLDSTDTKSPKFLTSDLVNPERIKVLYSYIKRVIEFDQSFISYFNRYKNFLREVKRLNS